MSLLEVRGLEVSFGGGPTGLVVEALDVARGETLAVIGPNGSGKSTLFAALACVRPWRAGRLTFEGRPVEPTGPAALDYRRRIATVMQQPLLLDTAALDNAAQGLRYRGVGRREARAKAQAWLDRLGVGPLARRRARHLSGGEAQRVSLARAMAIEPRLLLLDEPFASLDAPSRAAFIDDLRRVLAETETTALLVTHDRSEALMLADRVAVLLEGRIVQVGTPTEVFEAPVDERVAAFVGVETIQPGVLESVDDGLGVVRVLGPGGAVSRVEVRTDLPAGSAVHVCVRPEDVAVSPGTADADGREGATSVRNRLSGAVVGVVPLEGRFRVTIDCGFPLVATVTKRAFTELGLREGCPVVAAFKATAAHLVPRRSDAEPGRHADPADRTGRLAPRHVAVRQEA